MTTKPRNMYDLFKEHEGCRLSVEITTELRTGEEVMLVTCEDCDHQILFIIREKEKDHGAI